MEEFTGKFELIDPKLIIIDHRYQRPEKESLIATIGADFKWSSFGALIVYRRGHQVYAVDGQQRLNAALSQDKPPKGVPCIVFPESSLQKEAQSFLDVQINRKAVTAYEKHEAELVAKNPPAMAIQRAVDMVGYTIGLGGSNGAGEHRTIHAVRALHYVYDLLGEDGVVQVLTQTREAWPDDPKGHSVHMLKGVANLIHDMGIESYNRNKVTAALKETTPADILRKARGFQIDAGGSMRQNVDRAIQNLVKV